MDFLENVDVEFWVIALRILLFVGVLIVGRSLAGLTRKWLIRSLKRTTLTESLNTLLVTVSYYTVLLITVMLALVLLGVPATTVVGIVGLVVVVLAIALQASLGNLAATVNFLLFKPFEVGDIVSTMGVMGVVKEIQIFSTVIATPDLITHVLPNGAIQGAGLANYSKNGHIRVDLTFGISYESDLGKAKDVLTAVLTNHPDVLEDPAPQVFLQKLNDSSVDLAARPFVEIAVYLPFQAVINELVKKAFDEAGIVIPYPQTDVHLIPQNSSNES
ncbi:MAG: mechanosensitive ion channel family protein [Anaerolineae bacterium]|nr:mechanosensitive ion channel family protein [Anaerolineae bacterium]